MIGSLVLRRCALQMAACFVAIAVTGCAQPRAATSAAAIPPVPAGQARIWLYRDYEPYVSLNRPYIRFNGAIVGISEPGGATYRDVVPGQYYVTVDSIGTDINQFTTVAVVPGQQVYLKILCSKDWDSGGDRGAWAHDTFYTRLELPQVASYEIVRHPFYGGS